MYSCVMFDEKWPVLVRHDRAVEWLQVWSDLGRADVALFVRELAERPHRRGANVVSIGSGEGLSNAAVRQRLVPVCLFYGFLVEEGLRESDPVGRGRFVPGRCHAGTKRGLVPRFTKLPWIPDEQEWLEVLAAVVVGPARDRLVLALACGAALRREGLCSLRADDIDPGRRVVRVRAEARKSRRERMVPYSAPTGVLLAAFLAHRATIGRARGPLFLSESGRSFGEPLTLWAWSMVVRRIALASGVGRFSTHTTRHLCLTDLARTGWELHAIATFAGRRHADTTLQCIHLSGRGLAEKLLRGMEHVHAWRIAMFHALGRFQRLALARQVFGRERVEVEIGRIRTVPASWGCKLGQERDQLLPMVVCRVMLLVGSPHVEDLTTGLF